MNRCLINRSSRGGGVGRSPGRLLPVPREAPMSHEPPPRHGPAQVHRPFPPPPGGPPPAPAGPGPEKSGGGVLKWVVAAVAVLALLTIGGVIYGLASRADSGPDTGPQAGGSSISISYEELSGLLKDHSRALQEEDEDAYLAPFVGEELREEQRALFANLAKVPFSEAAYTISSAEGRGTDTYGQGASLTVDVAFVHQIENVDAAPVAEWYRWKVGKASQGAELEVTDVAGSKRQYVGRGGIVYYPAPWDLYEDMLAIRKENVLVLGDQKKAEHIKRIAPVVEQAARDDLAAWQSAGPETAPAMPGFVVTLENDRKAYERLYRKKKTNKISEAGVSYALPSHGPDAGEDDIVIGGARIVMDTGSSRFQGADWREGALEISRHEIAHSMVAHTEGSILDGDAQRWVVEGFGDYMAFRDNDEPASRAIAHMKKELAGIFDGQLPENHNFYRSIAGNPNYTLGYLAIRFVAEKGGEDAAFTFVTEHYKKPEQLDQQLRKAVGMSTNEFEAAWADYVRKVMR